VGGWSLAHVVEHLPSKCEALNSNPSTAERGREGEEERGREKYIYLLNTYYLQRTLNILFTDIIPTLQMRKLRLKDVK
jgi:hypothetical protein